MKKAIPYATYAAIGLLCFAFFIWYIVGYAKDLAGGGGNRAVDTVFDIAVVASSVLAGFCILLRGKKTTKNRLMACTLFVGSGVMLTLLVSNATERSGTKYKSPLAHEFAAAVDQMEKSPPGVKRVEEFCARLKAMAAREGTPPGLKQALQDYAATMEEAMVALKTGMDATAYDRKLAEEKKRLLSNLRN